MENQKFMEKEFMLLLHPETDAKVKAISSKTRRTVIGILYVYGPLFNYELENYTGLKTNKLAYHMKILKEAGYVSNVYLPERSRGAFSKYNITDEGIKFLEYIGAKSKLDELASKINQTR